VTDGFSNPIIGGGGALVYPSIHSPNFNVANPPASPTPSWAVLKSGLAYFFGLALAGGTITGPNYIINTVGIFFYRGTPGANNLLASMVPNASSVVDPFGNRAFPGFATYGPLIGGTYLAYWDFNGAFSVSSGTSQASWTSTHTVSQVSPVIVANAIQNLSVLIGGPYLLDSFNPITLDANWSTLAGQPVPSVQLTNDGMAHITGAIQFNVNISNTNINGGNPLSAAYRPATQIFIAGAPGSAGIAINTNGVIVAAQAPGQTTVFCNFNGRYPLNL
jgi:hypothetical protein